MPNIQINIKNKVARADRVIIVCDNSDYTAVFDFDDEWSAYDTKTARFVYGGRYTDVVFSGNSCPIPEIHDSRSLTIGVYAGDLHTTTPAYVSCVPSILCGNGIPADPTPDVYAQIMELLNKESGIWYPAVDGAGNMSWTRSISETEPQPVNIKGPKGDAGTNGVDGNDGVSPTVSVAAITGGNRVTITDAEGAKTFDVMDGAQGASGADGKDYVLTDADKQEIAKTAAGLVDVPSVQPDWNQNGPTAADYIKNRPFYADELLYVTLDGAPHIWYKVSSDIPSVVNPKSGDYINLWINGEKTTFTIRYDSETGYATNDVACCVAFSDDASIYIDGIALVLPERGTYFSKIEIGDNTQIVTGVAADGSSTPEITWDGNTGTVKQLDAKFIPDMDSVILNSSTAGSTKKFRITVDDSGTITATEVS